MGELSCWGGAAGDGGDPEQYPLANAEVVPLEAMLTGEPFPPARFATPEEVQEAKRELKETHAPSKIAHLNAFRQGELLDDHVAELYLAALQDRIAAEDTLPDTFIFSWWRRYCPDQKPGDPPVHLPKLSATELQRCEAAKFILFPLKLYTTEEGDDGNNSFFHFALGVIDRENHVVRIVDCLREEHSYYTPALKQLQMLAHELEWQIDVQSNAYRTPSQYTISRQAPEPGFSSLKPKSGYEGTVSFFNNLPGN
ncbi:hypothetical protein EMWEY_00020770 [Eimeria maxima]|uniref:Uncharacterized protein n=1 Tax=Eimeria maxima TaxID=5804 RepID=U6M5E0_EIMMA|nr:hypothetical protein EMWEY_00020770 [Eimeria maxima]CDJ59241.1 hypothetical protein EMWEY_00020770 [Eimeria maxima]